AKVRVTGFAKAGTRMAMKVYAMLVAAGLAITPPVARQAMATSPSKNNIQSVTGIVEVLNSDGSTEIQLIQSERDPASSVDFRQSPYVVTVYPIGLLRLSDNASAEVQRLGNPPGFESYASYGDWNIPTSIVNGQNVVFGYGAFGAGSRDGWRSPPPP